MFSQPSQTLWAIDRPFNRRDFTFFEQSSRSRDLTKSTLQAVCLQAVQWAHRMGAIQVPTPSFGEIVLTLFDSFDAEPDEDSSLRILASVMASTSIDGRACIGDALREILRQRSPLVQRVRREASLSAERAARFSLDELFASPLPVRQPLAAMFSTSQSDRTPFPSGADQLAERMSRLEMNTEAMLHRLTAAAPPPAPTPLVDTAPPPQVTVEKSKPVVAVTPAPVPVPAVVRVVTPAPVVPAPESVEESNEDDEDSEFTDLLLGEALAVPDAGAEPAPSVVESVPEDERSGNKEALSPELYTNLLDHRRWPGVCNLHGRADVMKKFHGYYEEFTNRHKHDAAALFLVLRSSAAICEVDLDLPGPAFKKIRFQVVQQIQTIIARFEFWKIEYEKGTLAASAAEATLLNQAMPKHIQHSRNVSEKVAAKAERAATAPTPPAGSKGAKKPGGKGK